MNIILKHDLERIDWEGLAQVFERAPLGKRDPEKLRLAFEKSYLRCFAYCEGNLVGAARAISDGEYYAGIYDVVIAPEYQRRGIGKQMMGFLLERLPNLQVFLISVPGKEDFYRKLHFRRNKTAMTRYPNPDKAAGAGYIE